MADYLVIRIAADRDLAAEWIAVDGNGARKGPPESGTLTQAAAAVGDRGVIVLVPAAHVLTTTVDIPIKSGSRLLAALPFALEEHLADEIDNMHFAAGARRESGRLPVAAVARSHIEDWLERLEQAGIHADRVVPENYGLARIPGTLSMLITDGLVMFNDGEDNEFVMQDVRPTDLLVVAGIIDYAEPEASSDSADGSKHLQVYCDPGVEEEYRHDWMALRHDLASVDINLLPDGVLPRLAVTVAAGNGVNLLQGRYGRREEIGTLFRPWKYAAMLLISLVVVVFAGKVADVYRLSKEETALRTQFTQLYREIRPNDASDIVDPAATVSSLRRSLGSPMAATVFLPSLQQLGVALEQHRTAEIEAISYRAGIIDVRLTAPDVATLDSIQRIVSNSGRFSASIESTDNVGDKISSRIQIREAGA